MSTLVDDFESDGDDDGEELEDPRLAALVEALAKGEAVDWQQAESSAASAEEKDQIRALAAIAEVATFHRTWLAEGGIVGDLDEEEEQDDEVPTHWGELEILERVGRGSFGDVYKAREPRLDRIVALKLIRASAKTPEREAETLREGRLLAKVRHPNVATVHGAAGADGRVGFWMEFLEGKNLAEILLEQKRFEPREAAEIGIALCRALAAVHAQGIVRRDVKAQNVVRENDGRIVLTDFGVGRDTALLQSEEPSLSGTPLYLAPELFEGKTPSPASDLYALGVLLFYLVTGEFPITGNSFDELRAAHEGRKRRWLKELRKDLPGTFVAAVERALDRDPEKRVGEAEMEKELGRFLGERLEQRRRIQKWSAAVMVALLCGGGLSFYLVNARKREEALDHLGRAERFQDQGLIQDAIAETEEAERLSPDLPAVYWHLMSYKSAHGDHVGALNAAQRGMPLCDGASSRDCLLVNAWEALLQMDYKRARDFFERAAKVKDDEDIEKEIAQVYKNLAQPALGLPAARKLADAQGVVEAGELALMLSAANYAVEAQSALKSLRSMFPKEDYVHWVAGTVNLATGDRKTAENEFRILVDKPQDAGYASTGRLLLAQALMFRSAFSDAKDLLAKDASLDTEEGFSRNDALRSILFAECLVRTGDPQEASRALKAVLRLEAIPPSFKLFRNAALVSLEAGDIPLAKAFSTTVTTLATKYPSDLSKSFDLQLQGELAWRRGDFTSALQLIEDARKYRDDPQNALSLARVQVEQKRCDLALRFLKDVVARRGIILDDLNTPWVIWNDAKELQRTCEEQGANSEHQQAASTTLSQ